MQQAKHIVLIGPMGAGKSTLGAALAARLGLPFEDLDAHIVRDAGQSITAIFASEGEAGFRLLEARALGAALAQPAAVIATGGGVILAADNRAALRRHGLVVYLRIDPTIQLQRLQGDASRPLLQEADPAAVLARLQAQREALYRATAHLAFDSAALPVDAAASALAQRIACLEANSP